MYTIERAQALILNSQRNLPSRGIICAHPGRAKRIADSIFKDTIVHTDYRGFQVYVGYYKNQPVFAANTGIGAPAAAFITEELISFGAKRIIRLGSNDGPFHGFKLNIVRETTLPLGLCLDYRFESSDTAAISESLQKIVRDAAKKHNIHAEFTLNRHIDGYFPVNFEHKPKSSNRYTSQDMESGALYLLARIRGIECLSVLISYPKHETTGEYRDNGQTKEFEDKSIHFVLDLLMGE